GERSRRDRVAAVTASGRIQPKKKVDISADITGRITRIAVREGDLVTKGQFLLQIDPTVYQANLQQAEATLASSQAAAVQAKANRDQAERGLGLLQVGLIHGRVDLQQELALCHEVA